MVGVPINKLTSDESEKLINMPDILKNKIIGQDDAVEKVCESIQRARAGVDNPNKPIGSFLFLGQTGVGKCICSNSKITIKNKITGEIEIISISNLLNKI